LAHLLCTLTQIRCVISFFNLASFDALPQNYWLVFCFLHYIVFKVLFAVFARRFARFFGLAARLFCLFPATASLV
ncbi:MAG TPA: hypothetical protein VN538_09910, partial [Clostridia bacterium]|nr:hypothetical protein [Clostridia bacterium]